MTGEKFSPLNISGCLDIRFGVKASCDKRENAVWQRDDIMGWQGVVWKHGSQKDVNVQTQPMSSWVCPTIWWWGTPTK